MNGFSRKNRRGVVILFIVLVTIIQVLVLGTIAKEKRAQKVQDAYAYGSSLTSAISLTLENVVSVSETLNQFYYQYEDAFLEDFEEVATRIMEIHPEISSLYLAPDGIIQAAYPSSVKDKTMGFHMLKDPAQGPRAKLTMESGLVTVAGPHNLIEGGLGLILRNPIYKEGRFLGFSVIILDWNELVNKILSSYIVNSRYKVAIWKDSFDETAVTDVDGYILRNTREQISKKVDLTLDVPNDVWHLVVEPTDGWLAYHEMGWDIVISLIISITLIILVIFSFILEERSKRLAEEETENKTKEHYMSQLQEALDKAKKADAAKSRFLSRMSHDIRTPLNGIIGLIEINEKHADDKAFVNANRAKAKVAANHLLSLISDVLELSKMEDENVLIAHEPLDLQSLASDVMTITGLRASEAGVNLVHWDVKTEIPYPYVYGSPLHIRQVFLNILGNCIKYNRKGGYVECHCKLKSKSESQVIYEFIISDSGIGMSKQFLTHIFEPFSQEHSDARSTYQGTGLGMSIVKTLLGKMGGSIDIASEEGEGSTFVLTIPFELASSEDVPRKATSEDVDIKGLKVLLAEDNDLNMEIAKTILEDLGVEVQGVVDGFKAFEAYKLHPVGTYDCILMDLMMPVMDGFAATDAIRSYEREDAKTLPIYAMTANAFAEDEKKCLAHGMNGHLAKPLDLEKLKKILSSIAKEGKRSEI